MAQERRRSSRDDEDGRKDNEMYESVIQIKRCAAVVKGGRRFSFNALVVVGDRKGRVGFGYAKAKEVPPAVDKAVKTAHRSLNEVSLRGTTLPHPVLGRYGASKVVLIPAAPGTGVIAGRGVRDVMIAAGVTDVLTKNLGSTNPVNVVKAALDGLRRLRMQKKVEELRGVAL